MIAAKDAEFALVNKRLENGLSIIDVNFNKQKVKASRIFLL